MPSTLVTDKKELKMGMVSDRKLGLFVVGAVSYNLFLVLLLHAAQPELNPLKVPMSAYVLGRLGGLFTTTYFVMAAIWLAIDYGLVRSVPPSRLSRVAFTFALVACVGACLAGSFPMDYPPPIRTLSGRLHALGGLVTFPSMVIATSFWSLSVHRYERSRLSIQALSLSAGLALAFAMGLTSILILGFGGWAQRLLIALLYAWMLTIAVALIRSSRSQ